MPGWWPRLLAAALFGFYLNYVPIHLATAMHLDDLLESVHELALHHHGHQGHGHDDHDASKHHDENEQHVPHPASDHNLNLTGQTQLPTTTTLAYVVFCTLTDSSALIQTPLRRPPIPVLERIKPPGESPPGPLRPRAPPLA